MPERVPEDVGHSSRYSQVTLGGGGSLSSVHAPAAPRGGGPCGREGGAGAHNPLLTNLPQGQVYLLQRVLNHRYSRHRYSLRGRRRGSRCGGGVDVAPRYAGQPL